MSTHNLCFEQKYEKYQNFSSENFQFFGGKIFNIFEKACFRNGSVERVVIKESSRHKCAAVNLFYWPSSDLSLLSPS